MELNATDLMEWLKTIINAPDPQDTMNTLHKFIFTKPQMDNLSISHIWFQKMTLDENLSFLERMESVKPKFYHDWSFSFNTDNGKISLLFRLITFDFVYPPKCLKCSKTIGYYIGQGILSKGEVTNYMGKMENFHRHDNRLRSVPWKCANGHEGKIEWTPECIVCGKSQIWHIY